MAGLPYHCQLGLVCGKDSCLTASQRWLAATTFDTTDDSHLTKWPSDLKSNGTQENITFSGPVFHGLSCGIFLFVASVSFKNHLLNGLNFSTANQVLLFYGFWS